MQETKNLNIAEILRYAPKGLPLYSPLLGECKFDYSSKTGIITVRAGNSCFTFHKNGQYYEDMGDCLLFPSKEHQSWDNWQQILLPQSIGSVCASFYTSTKKLFLCTPKGVIFIHDNNPAHSFHSWRAMTKDYCSCCKYATREETDQFFKELKRRGYKWNGEEIIEEQPNKFDVSTLKPFDKVLIRDSEDYHWGVGLFAAYTQEDTFPFICNASSWKQCVPYNKETEYLIGTKKEAPDFYKTW